MARAVLGDDWMPLSHVARPDDTAFAGVVEVSLLGARADLPGWSQQWYQAFGPFELRGWNNPEAATVLLDFVDELGPAGVSVRTLKSGRAQVCPYGKRRVSNGDLHGHSTFPAQRFACAGGNWHFVGVTVIEDQNYRPRRCIWAHPGQNETLQIEFLDVVVGSELRGYGGLPYFRGRQSHGTPVEMEVLVGGHSLGAYTHKDGEGWSPFRWSTESWKGRRMDVQFQIRSRRVAHREFCFQADLR